MKNGYVKDDLHLTPVKKFNFPVIGYNSYFNNPVFNLYAHLKSKYI